MVTVNVANFGIPCPGYYKDSLFVCKFFTSVQDFRGHAKGEDVITLALRESQGDPDELLKELAENFYGDMIKGVVDVEQELLALALQYIRKGEFP